MILSVDGKAVYPSLEKVYFNKQPPKDAISLPMSFTWLVKGGTLLILLTKSLLCQQKIKSI